MREEKDEEAEEGNWFSRWEEELPSPEELMPLSQTLITPDLAMAFDIPNPNTTSPTPTPAGFHTPSSSHHHQHQHQQVDFESADPSGGGSGGGGGGDESARTLKRPRLVWTPQLHKRFVDAVAHLGIKNAVPKTIMQLMSVDGLTRENVASHLQKYRLYLKRMQGLNSGGGGGGGSSCSPADAATDQLFASAPIPHHFLTRGGSGGGGGGGRVAGQTDSPSFMPFVPVAALQHHQQMVAAAAATAAQQQYYQQRQMGFDHGFLTRGPPQPGFGRMGMHGMVQPVSAAAYNVDDLDEGNRGGGRKVLTLFPTGDN